jgi:hypothetical protein
MAAGLPKRRQAASLTRSTFVARVFSGLVPFLVLSVARLQAFAPDAGEYRDAPVVALDCAESKSGERFMYRTQRNLATDLGETTFAKKRLTHVLIGVLALLAFFAVAPRLASAQSGALRSIVTTGWIAAGSNSLTVADVSGFAVGDWVIVEIGKEPGQGMRGTRGVGGSWPSYSYPTVDAMNASTTVPATFVWVESTGVVYQRIDGQWKIPWPPAYYTAKAIPRSLQARITTINGSTLTLDKSAVIGVSGANVYLDVAPIINQSIANASTGVTVPPGNFAIGGTLWILDKTGFTFAGSGKSQTKFFSPKGVPSAQLEIRTSPNSTIRDFTSQGNWRDNGFGLNWTGSTPAASFQPASDVELPQGSHWPRAINVTMSSHRSVVKDIEVIDTAQMAVMVTFADEIWAFRVSNIQNDPMRQYLQWQFQWVNTTGGGCVDCSIVSPKVIAGFEAFRSKNVSFIRPRGVNATFAANGAGGWLVEDADLRFTAGSLDFERAVNWSAGGYPIFNINVNGGFMDYLPLGGTIRNAKVVQEGYANAAGETLPGSSIQDRTPNIRIEGGTFAAPDYDASTGKGGSVGVSSRGTGTYVANVRVTGLPNPAAPNVGNIYVQAACIVNGGGNLADPRTPGSIYFFESTPPAEGCTKPSSTSVIPIGSREPTESGTSTSTSTSGTSTTTTTTDTSTGTTSTDTSTGTTSTDTSTGTTTTDTSGGTSTAGPGKRSGTKDRPSKKR